MRIIGSLALFLLPIVPAVAFMEATTEPADANIGGGIVLSAALIAGTLLAIWNWKHRS